MPLLPIDTGTPAAGAQPQQSAIGKLGNDLLNIVDPGQFRLQVAKLFTGGTAAPAKNTAMVPQVFTAYSNKDWRVKLTLADQSKAFSSSETNAIAKIIQTMTSGKSTYFNGVVFPYVPTVNVTYNTRYAEQKLTHANYSSFFYEGSEVQAITLSGEFTVQNQGEGLYLLACIYFLRAAGKMFFGASADAGQPPPMLYLDGYGEAYFPHVPCVLTQFTHTMPADVDYVEVQTGGTPTQVDNAANQCVNIQSVTRVPTVSTIQITLQPVYSRSSVSKFDLQKFANGGLINGGKGGFI